MADVCRKTGKSTSTYFKRKAKFGGMEASDIRRMRELEEETRQLKRMYADLSLDHRILKDVLEKKPREQVKGGR